MVASHGGIFVSFDILVSWHASWPVWLHSSWLLCCHLLSICVCFPGILHSQGSWPCVGGYLLALWLLSSHGPVSGGMLKEAAGLVGRCYIVVTQSIWHWLSCCIWYSVLLGWWGSGSRVLSWCPLMWCRLIVKGCRVQILYYILVTMSWLSSMVVFGGAWYFWGQDAVVFLYCHIIAWWDGQCS